MGSEMCIRDRPGMGVAARVASISQVGFDLEDPGGQGLSALQPTHQHAADEISCDSASRPRVEGPRQFSPPHHASRVQVPAVSRKDEFAAGWGRASRKMPGIIRFHSGIPEASVAARRPRPIGRRVQVSERADRPSENSSPGSGPPTASDFEEVPEPDSLYYPAFGILSLIHI